MFSVLVLMYLFANGPFVLFLMRIKTVKMTKTRRYQINK